MRYDNAMCGSRALGTPPRHINRAQLGSTPNELIGGPTAQRHYRGEELQTCGNIAASDVARRGESAGEVPRKRILRAQCCCSRARVRPENRLLGSLRRGSALFSRQLTTRAARTARVEGR